MKCPSYVEFYKFVPKMLLFHMSKQRNYLDKNPTKNINTIGQETGKVFLYLALLGEEGTFKT